MNNDRELNQAKQLAAVAEERTRIARELHDTTAHHLSGIAIQTTAARALLDTDPAAARTQLEGISTSITAALNDVRTTVSTLRTSSDVELKPQPTTNDIPTLIAQCRSIGMRIETTGPGLGELPTNRQQCAYRVLQEALTNARLHAPDESVVVQLSAGGLAVRTSGTFTAARIGRGSLGMKERAEACNANLRNEPDTAGWIVELTWE